MNGGLKPRDSEKGWMVSKNICLVGNWLWCFPLESNSLWMLMSEERVDACLGNNV